MQRADMNEFGISDDEMQEDVSHCPKVLGNIMEVEDLVTESGQNPLARDRKQSASFLHGEASILHGEVSFLHAEA